MFKRRKKAQGALEYLLLIGGAVLIAVIVIALLVGMGGQSRDAAKKQADKANATMSQPTPASITNIIAKYSDCNTDTNVNIAKMTFSWVPGDGANTLFLTDTNGTSLDLNSSSTNDTNKGLSLNPTIKGGIRIDVNGITNCTDSYNAYVKTVKNNIPVTSMIYPVSWNR